MHRLIAILLFFICLSSYSQTLYFPPTSGTDWDTLSPDQLGWCQDSIDLFHEYLDSTNTKAFIVLKDGKIVLEKYFGTFEQDSLWYWASAGKSLTATLVGIAQQEGDLNINNKTSDYLGTGWTLATSQQEEAITVWHQLTMTSGLNEFEFDCVVDTCLTYKTPAGTRWAYHNGPYLLLRDVIEAATGQDYNLYTTLKIKSQTGMDGLWYTGGGGNLFISTARSMARFGLLTLNKGVWDGTTVLSDTSYYNAMVSSSQSLNPSYGYLWWLNGKDSYIPPGISISIPGMMAPNAPEDMFCAAGKNGQFCFVVPSQNLVIIRMGEASGNDFVPISYMNDLWTAFNKVSCPVDTSITGLMYAGEHQPSIKVRPNPANQVISVSSRQQTRLNLFNITGKLVYSCSLEPGNNVVDISHLATGTYIFEVPGQSGKLVVH